MCFGNFEEKDFVGTGNFVVDFSDSVALGNSVEAAAGFDNFVGSVAEPGSSVDPVAEAGSSVALAAEVGSFADLAVEVDSFAGSVAPDNSAAVDSFADFVVSSAGIGTFGSATVLCSSMGLPSFQLMDFHCRNVSLEEERRSFFSVAEVAEDKYYCSPTGDYTALVRTANFDYSCTKSTEAECNHLKLAVFVAAGFQESVLVD